MDIIRSVNETLNILSCNEQLEEDKMKRPMFKRGFKAVKEEEERREQLKEQFQGKLWRVFFPKDADDDYEIPVRFLTDEPICYSEHSLKINGKYVNAYCKGDGCPHCANDNKPRFVGAFLVIDRTEFSYTNKEGKKVEGKDRVKLLVRGTQDLAVLDRLNTKYGLLDRDWAIYKTGKDTSTKWNFERGDIEEMTEKEIQALLPESLRGKDLYEILEEEIMGTESDVEEEEEDIEEVSKGVQSLDEDDEDDEIEETPRKLTKSSKLRRGSKLAKRK